jgi:hypothetical protein
MIFYMCHMFQILPFLMLWNFEIFPKPNVSFFYYDLLSHILCILNARVVSILCFFFYSSLRECFGHKSVISIVPCIDLYKMFIFWFGINSVLLKIMVYWLRFVELTDC